MTALDTTSAPASRGSESPPAPAVQAEASLAPVLLGGDGRPTPQGWRLIGARLREPMRAFRSNKRGGSFDYITARQVQTRLDDVVGPGNWASKVKIVRSEPPVVAQVSISIYGVWRSDVGYSNNPDAIDEEIEYTDKATGELLSKRNPAFEHEPLKAAVSDGFKRAAVQWGIGRFLYQETQRS